MNNPDSKKNDVETIAKEIPPSIIPLEKVIETIVENKVDLNLICKTEWSKKSNDLVQDFNYGLSLAQFGENPLNIRKFFQRFSQSLRCIIINEHQKRGVSSEHLIPHFNILDSCLNLISLEIEKKELKDFKLAAIIAALNGYIINYK